MMYPLRQLVIIAWKLFTESSSPDFWLRHFAQICKQNSCLINGVPIDKYALSLSHSLLSLLISLFHFISPSLLSFVYVGYCVVLLNLITSSRLVRSADVLTGHLNYQQEVCDQHAEYLTKQTHYKTMILFTHCSVQFTSSFTFLHLHSIDNQMLLIECTRRYQSSHNRPYVVQKRIFTFKFMFNKPN